MAQLNSWIAQAIGHNPTFLPVPDVAAGLLAKYTGWLPGAPITADQWAMLQKDNVVGADSEGFAAIGVTPTALAAEADAWLVQYRKHGRFGASAKA